MARINIDDQFWTDILPIVAALGDADRAVGQVVRFFKLAQEKHKNGKLISEDDFTRGAFSESLVGVFADRVTGGIQAVGAQKHFGWLAKRVTAGRSGGLSKTEAKTSKLKQNRSKTEASPSPSYSSSYSSSPSSLKNAHAEAFALFWESYPRKVGKGKAEKSYKGLINSGMSPDLISKSLGHYLAYLRREKIEAKFILHGPTFLNQVKDWLDPQNGKSESFAGAAASDSWETSAKRVLDVLVSRGSGSKALIEIEHDLGPELFRTTLKAGTQRIRDERRGPFQLKNIAAMLKDAAGSLGVTNVAV